MQSEGGGGRGEAGDVQVKSVDASARGHATEDVHSSSERHTHLKHNYKVTGRN